MVTGMRANRPVTSSSVLFQVASRRAPAHWRRLLGSLMARVPTRVSPSVRQATAGRAVAERRAAAAMVVSICVPLSSWSGFAFLYDTLTARTLAAQGVSAYSRHTETLPGKGGPI